MPLPIGFGQQPLPARVELPALRLVASRAAPMRVAVVVAVCFVLVVVFMAFAPWQQYVAGKGRVIAYAPLERQQVIEAPISGRAVRWWVQEGQHVEAGDKLLLLGDNDPMLVARLEEQRAAVVRQQESYQGEVDALTTRVDSTIRSRDHKIESSEAKLRSGQQKVERARQRLKGAEARLETALLQLARQRTLAEQGLTSQRELELATLGEAQARTDRDAARDELESEQELVEAARAELDNERADGDAKIDKARSELYKAQTSLAEVRLKLNDLDTKLARQSAQEVIAPRGGTVLRLLAAQGGEQVKQGDPLLVLVPDARDRAVELWVDGNDAALLRERREVRLQFEGWPAIQFAGWPSVAVGTFGGEVAFVDSLDDGSGNFRVLVRPKPDDEPWPSPDVLRQGVRANGWVLLDEVRLGFEVWRQLNGFPPTVPPPSTDPMAPMKGGKEKGDDKSSDNAGKGDAK